MKDGFIICRRMKDGTLKHLTFRESDVILIDDLLERLIQREIPTKTGAKAEDVFALMNGEQSPEEFLKEHRIDGFGSEAKRKLQSFVRTAKEDTKPLGGGTRMNWEQRFLTFELHAYEAMDELIGTTTKEYNRDIVTWESEQIYWGLIGNAEDRRNAREMIIKAKTEKEAKRAGDEYASCEKTRKRYKQEAKRRLELYDKFMEGKNDEANKH